MTSPPALSQGEGRGSCGLIKFDLKIIGRYIFPIIYLSLKGYYIYNKS